MGDIPGLQRMAYNFIGSPGSWDDWFAQHPGDSHPIIRMQSKQAPRPCGCQRKGAYGYLGHI